MEIQPLKISATMKEGSGKKIAGRLPDALFFGTMRGGLTELLKYSKHITIT